MARAHGARVEGGALVLRPEAPATQALERFTLADLARLWNPDWTLERAGFGGGHGGLGGLRGMTYLRGDVLATWPRDEVRGLVLRRSARLGQRPVLSVDVGVDPGRAWKLEVYADNQRLLSKVIEAPRGAGPSPGIAWQTVRQELTPFAGKTVHLRLYQRVLFTDRVAGQAYFRALRLEP
jgi:hypothetical protein